ncbi:hypothetical protein PT974_04043 [Cladobotryum mycophilum]|uniref:Transposase n=1 Tax=Cladobotryum mycophilum TaxID=491253 RepID=A0ABR0SUD0_9HYPO
MILVQMFDADTKERLFVVALVDDQTTEKRLLFNGWRNLSKRTISAGI